MRDTGDMMEDVLSEDTMMECSGDEALYDLIDLSTGISRSVPTIKEAAERLLTLLGVEEGDEEVLSSSEDEGVELDEGSEDEDEDGLENTRLLHQLAASLAQELKYSHKQTAPGTTRQSGAKTSHGATRDYHADDQMQCMEVAQENSYQEAGKSGKLISSHGDHSLEYTRSTGQGFFGVSNLEFNGSSSSPTKLRSETRLKINGEHQSEEKSFSAVEVSSWAAGWDACAAEAVRYLLEDEGLSPHHPTVLAMKNHLEIQRERALAQYSM